TSSTIAAPTATNGSTRRRGNAPRRSREDVAIAPRKLAKTGSRPEEFTPRPGAAKPTCPASALARRAVGRALLGGGLRRVLLFAGTPVLVHDDLGELGHGGLRRRLVEHDGSVLDHADAVA